MTATGQSSKRDAVEYIQSMIREVGHLAEANRCDYLSYLLQMCYLEASDILRGERPFRSDAAMLLERTGPQTGNPIGTA